MQHFAPFRHPHPPESLPSSPQKYLLHAKRLSRARVKNETYNYHVMSREYFPLRGHGLLSTDDRMKGLSPQGGDRLRFEIVEYKIKKRFA